METGDDLTNDSDVSMARVSGLLNNSAVTANIVSGIFKINNKRGRSKVWDVFGPIENENGDELPNLVACKNCFSVYKFNTKSTSNLVKHKCYVFRKIETDDKIEKTEIDDEEKEQSELLVTKWTIENCRPFNIIEDSGLRNFVEFLISIGATHGKHVDIDKLLPHPTTVSCNIKTLHNKYFEVMKSEIMSVKNIGYGLTSDIWTDNYLRTAYLSLTIHYVKEGKLFARLLGLKSMKGESCTGENILSKITTLLNEFECDLSKAIIVTDRGSNMIAAFRSFNHIFCMNHLLDNVVEKSIKEIPEIIEICNICTKLVKYFKKSGINCSLQNTLKSNDCTKFNSMYYLLFSIEKSWLDIKNVLRERNELQKISNINLSCIGALVKILSSFEETSKTLEGENYPTLHLTIVHIHRLKKICAVNFEDLEVIKNFKTKLSSFMDSIVVQNLTLNHKIALFLFPPTNKLIQLSEAEKNTIKDECKNLMQGYANEMPKQEAEVFEQLVKTEELELDCLATDSKGLFADFIQPVEVVNSNDKINIELLAYENVNVMFHEDFDVLEWWHLHQVEFPVLYKVSCKILATPASSVASERIFSSARTLISEKRCLLGTDSILVNQIMFLHSNINQIEICKIPEELSLKSEKY